MVLLLVKQVSKPIFHHFTTWWCFFEPYGSIWLVDIALTWSSYSINFMQYIQGIPRYPLVNCPIAMERSTMLSMGKSTISTGPSIPLLFVCSPEGIPLVRMVNGWLFPWLMDGIPRYQATILWDLFGFPDPGPEPPSRFHRETVATLKDSHRTTT